VGDILGNFLGDGSIKFFNRSPLTLKIWGRKIRERESRKRKRERAKKERERARARAQVVVFTFASLFLFYTRKLMFFLV